MKTYFKILAFFIVIISIHSCKTVEKKIEVTDFDNKINFIGEQYSLLLADSEKENNIPRTVENGEISWINKGFDWTEGFFPGSCWYLFELTKDEKWKSAAEKFQSLFERHKYQTTNHDLGFVFGVSYGNGYKLTHNEAYKDVMITAANSLITRFNPVVGSIKSWDVDNGWQSKRDWKFPVIIDNMMNLELLFEVSEFTGDEKYKNIAIAHANTTLKNHYRTDNSSYHVVDYDPETGSVRGKQTAQGYANESSWARGQAWGLYGFTVCYRYTNDEKYLEQAQKIADYIIDYKGTPSDGIPYWDYNAKNIPNEPRDVSAATVTVSALIELNQLSNNKYQKEIDKLLNSLASNEYTAKIGENNNFILKHSVGSIPHNNEIDVPLNYADYYYIEALLRYKKLDKSN